MTEITPAQLDADAWIEIFRRALSGKPRPFRYPLPVKLEAEIAKLREGK